MLIAGLSGFAGLGYEIVWTRLLAVSLGHEIVAVLGVLAALFAGLATGSLVLGGRIAGSARPALWYAILELAIGAWALILIPLFATVGGLVPALVPVDASPAYQWLVAFALPFVLLLPATFAMGGTLPALEAMLKPHLAGGAVGPVYAANTLGAVAGTLVSTFILIPAMGLSATLGACAAINGLCAVAIWRAEGRTTISRPAPGSVAPAQNRLQLSVGLAPLFLTGFLGIGYEVLAIRVVSQILENTIYTFAVLLATYLLGTALGAALHGRLAMRFKSGSGSAGLVIATSLACVAGTSMLACSQTMLVSLEELMPANMAGRLAAELGIAAGVFLLPTVAMGALFAQLAQNARDNDGNLGAALAANTLGAALAPIVFGPILIPHIGAMLGFVAIAFLYLALLPNARPRALVGGGAAAALALIIALSPLSLRFAEVPPGGSLVWHRDGVMAAVTVVRDAGGTRHLQVNNHFRMGGTASIRSDHRQAHIPLLLHPHPKRALFLGLGTGATLSAAGDHPGLVADGVELVPEVVDSFPLFERSAPQLGRNSNLHIHVADARRFVRAAGEPYDVVVADLYHPSLDGSGSLYTSEHFAAIRSRLAADGLFCQWLPLHQLDLETLRIITRTFIEAFPDATAYLAQFSIETPLIALVGRLTPTTYSTDWLQTHVRDSSLTARLAAANLDNDIALFGLYLAGRSELQAFAGPGPLNTDDLPLVATLAPRLAYTKPDPPASRLVELLHTFTPKPGDVLREPQGDAGRRLADYWRARNRFIEIGAATDFSGTTRGNFIATVAPKLVEVVRLSADFEAAYLPVINMARQLALSDPEAARNLLEALDGANPSRPEARRLLAALPPAQLR